MPKVVYTHAEIYEMLAEQLNENQTLGRDVLPEHINLFVDTPKDGGQPDINFPDRKPYVVAILTQGPSSVDQPQRAVASLSEAVFEAVTT